MPTVARSRAFGDALAGSDRPLVIASGVLGMAPGGSRPSATGTRGRSTAAAVPRPPSHRGNDALASPTRGVRSSIVRLAPTVHGDGDHGFMAMLVGIAREQRRLRLHRRRYQSLARRAPARCRAPVPPGAGKGPGGVGAARDRRRGRAASRDIAEVIGRHLNVPVVEHRPGGCRRALRLARRPPGHRQPGLERADPRTARLAAGAARPHRRPRAGPLLPRRPCARSDASEVTR